MTMCLVNYFSICFSSHEKNTDVRFKKRLREGMLRVVSWKLLRIRTCELKDLNCTSPRNSIFMLMIKLSGEILVKA